MQFDERRTREDYSVDEMNYFKDYIKDFFKFYADFDYDNNVICPYSGQIIDKDYFQTKIDYDHPVTIAAPLMRRVNCAKYLTNLDLINFITACRFSYDYLKEYKPPKSYNDYEFYKR